MSTTECDPNPKDWTICPASDDENDTAADVNKTKPWVLAGIAAPILLVLGSEALMPVFALTAIGGGLIDSLPSQQKTKWKNQCSLQQSLCGVNAGLEDLLTQIKDIGQDISKLDTTFTDTLKEQLNTYYTKTSDARAEYSAIQKKIALTGLRVCIFFFFVILADMLGIWPINKIWKS